MDKATLLAELIDAVAADLDAATLSQKTAHEGATHEESRAENDKDTRGLETSYLARGLAKRVTELQAALNRLKHFEARPFDDDDKVALGALVTLEDDDGSHAHYFVLPAEGGRKLGDDGAPVRVVTPDSPLGKALIGKSLDDDVIVRTPKGTRECVVQALR